MSETANEPGNDTTPIVARETGKGAATSPPFGFVGLAGLGLPVALRLARRFPLLGCDTDPALLSHLADAATDGRVHTTPILAEVAKRCDVIALLQPSSEQAEMTAAELAASARSGTMLLDLSVSDPAATRRLAAELSDRSIHLLDAVVLGSADEAANGTLTILAGGAGAVLAETLPYLEALGTVVPTGVIGSGQTVAALVAAVGTAGPAAMPEAFAVAEAAGVDPGRLGDPRLLKRIPRSADSLSVAVALGGALEVDTPVMRAALAAWRAETGRMPEP